MEVSGGRAKSVRLVEVEVTQNKKASYIHIGGKERPRGQSLRPANHDETDHTRGKEKGTHGGGHQIVLHRVQWGGKGTWDYT